MFVPNGKSVNINLAEHEYLEEGCVDNPTCPADYDCSGYENTSPTTSATVTCSSHECTDEDCCIPYPTCTADYDCSGETGKETTSDFVTQCSSPTCSNVDLLILSNLSSRSRSLNAISIRSK